MRYRSPKKRVAYTIAKKQIDMPQGWDYWWEPGDEKLSAKAQKAALIKLLKDPQAYANEGGTLDPTFKLCKVTFEIVS